MGRSSTRAQKATRPLFSPERKWGLGLRLKRELGWRMDGGSGGSRDSRSAFLIPPTRDPRRDGVGGHPPAPPTTSRGSKRKGATVARIRLYAVLGSRVVSKRGLRLPMDGGQPAGREEVVERLRGSQLRKRECWLNMLERDVPKLANLLWFRFLVRGNPTLGTGGTERRWWSTEIGQDFLTREENCHIFVLTSLGK